MSILKPRLPLPPALPLGRRTPLRLVKGPPPPDAAPFELDTQPSGRVWARRYRAKLLASDVTVLSIAVASSPLAAIGATHPPGTPVGGYLAVSLLVVALWAGTLVAFHTRDSRVVGVGATEYKQVINATALTFGMLAIAFHIAQIDFARDFFLLALPLGIAALIVERWLWRRWLLRQRRFGHYLSRVIVVGEREDVEYVVGQIHEKSGAAYYVVGAALDSDEHASVVVAGSDRVPVVADYRHIAGAVSRMGADTVIVAGQPRGGSGFIRGLAWDLENTTADLVLSSRLTDVAGPRIHFRPVEGLPLIHVEIPRFEGTKHVVKRTFDMTVSAVALTLLAPLLLLIGAFIALDSSGGVLFTQERCGRGGRTFRMVKFRSMVPTAESDLAGLMGQNEGSGALFKMRNDPRVTRVGRVLRKYSLDELPQLWNILVGDMSLVGPRPPLPREVESYETHVHRRLYIKPGLTGMWQVNGRSDLSWEESVRLDLYYVENWSLAGDLMIMWRTIKAMVQPVGAY
ncbi:MAG: sugar transferase [Cryobacterium sp.]|jgi:exopolysaccharide biosynthesis polyprenyl glycosylphosphotransferase|nr:sugar transferase [Cryobacterium sp.]